MHQYFVYILCNKNNTTLYVGVTNNIELRVLEHKRKIHSKSFTARYNINKLVYYEKFGNINEAIRREKQLKKWRREWKNKIIIEMNPFWLDLSLDWYKPEDLILAK